MLLRRMCTWQQVIRIWRAVSMNVNSNTDHKKIITFVHCSYCGYASRTRDTDVVFRASVWGFTGVNGGILFLTKGSITPIQNPTCIWDTACISECTVFQTAGEKFCTHNASMVKATKSTYSCSGVQKEQFVYYTDYSMYLIFLVQCTLD